MNNSALPSNQATAVKISELASFLPFVCKRNEKQNLWFYSDFDDIVGEMALSFNANSAWAEHKAKNDKQTGKALAVGLSLPIPYVDEFQLFFGFLVEDYRKLIDPTVSLEANNKNPEEAKMRAAKVWVLPRSAKMLDTTVMHSVVVNHSKHEDLVSGLLVSNEEISESNLLSYELTEKEQARSLFHYGPEALYLRNPMVSRSSEQGQVAILPSLMELFGYLLAQELYSLEDAGEKRFMNSKLAATCAEDLYSLKNYVVLPDSMVIHTWEHGRLNLDPGYQGPYKTSHNVYSVLANIASVLQEPVFDTWDAVSLLDLDYLFSTSKELKREVQEKQESFITHLDVVQLIPANKTTGTSKAIVVRSLPLIKKWVVLNESEKKIGNPDGPKKSLDTAEIELRNPKTYEPSIVRDTHSEANDTLQTLVQLQGLGEISLTVQNCLCPTVESWISILMPVQPPNK